MWERWAGKGAGSGAWAWSACVLHVPDVTCSLLFQWKLSDCGGFLALATDFLVGGHIQGLIDLEKKKILLHFGMTKSDTSKQCRKTETPCCNMLQGRNAPTRYNAFHTSLMLQHSLVL